MRSVTATVVFEPANGSITKSWSFVRRLVEHGQCVRAIPVLKNRPVNPSHRAIHCGNPVDDKPVKGRSMDNQASHELLLELLAKHPSFAKRFKKRKKPLMAHEVKDFDAGESHDAAILVLTALNINSGSAGNHNLYELFDTYFSEPAARDEINRAVRRAKGLLV